MEKWKENNLKKIKRKIGINNYFRYLCLEEMEEEVQRREEEKEIEGKLILLLILNNLFMRVVIEGDKIGEEMRMVQE